MAKELIMTELELIICKGIESGGNRNEIVDDIMQQTDKK